MKSTNGNKLLYFFSFGLAFALCVGVILAQKAESPVQKEFPVGDPAPRTIFSPVHVQFVSEEETARLRQEKEASVLSVYRLDSKAKRSTLSRTEKALKDLARSRSELSKPESQERILHALTIVSERFLSEGVLEDERKRELLGSGKSQIHRFDSTKKSFEPREVKSLVSLQEAKEKAGLLLEKEGLHERGLRDAALEIFTSAFQSNLFYDEGQTKDRRKQALDSVTPIMEEVKRGEMVTQKGLLVTAKDEKRLIQVQKAMTQKQVQGRFVSVALFVLLGLSLCFLYLKYFEPREFSDPKYLLLVLSTLVATLLIEKITLWIPNSSPYLLPGALAAILLTVLWKPTVGILGALGISILSGPLAEFRADILLIILLGSLTGSFAAHGIRKRIHFLKVGVTIGLVNAAVMMAFALFQGWSLAEAWAVTPLGLANGFLVTTLSFFLIPLFEHLFNLTTDITLLELSDLNHPLLKRMVVEAPGTYHHSLVVSTLAEAACETIDANALLARVGCYFHDIGKIARSEYFTENQTPQTRAKHEKLTPTMSCLVIMGHVKDGIELARKHKLKDVIVRFIPEHQGRGVIYYFYKKALDQAAPGETVNADDFRYPGPKPQSRETAVALLSDSAEAASRSLKEINPDAIRTLVRKIINEKFIDGQLDECDLTLKDLHKIQESFVHNLMAIFHTRVSYPKPDEDPRRPDLFESDQFSKFH